MCVCVCVLSLSLADHECFLSFSVLNVILVVLVLNIVLSWSCDSCLAAGSNTQAYNHSSSVLSVLMAAVCVFDLFSSF